MRLHAMIVLGIGMVFPAALALAAADSKDEAIKKDRMKYAGTWQVVSLETDGDKADDQDAKKITVVNEADGKWTLEVDGNVIGRGTSEIDPTKKPKTLDLTATEGDGKGETTLGIYELGDDERKVCYAKTGMERPTEFSSAAGSGHTLVVLKRVKK